MISTRVTKRIYRLSDNKPSGDMLDHFKTKIWHVGPRPTRQTFRLLHEGEPEIRYFDLAISYACVLPENVLIPFQEYRCRG